MPTSFSSARPHRCGLIAFRLACLIGLACLLFSSLAASAQTSAHAQVPQGGSAQAHFTDAAEREGNDTNGFTILNPSGAVVASGDAPNGWSCNARYGQISAPASAALGTGYSAHDWTAFTSNDNPGYNLDAAFDVVVGSVSLTGLSLSPASVTGGATATGTIALSGPAPANGLTISLTSDNAAATVPASVPVAASASGTTFPITTTEVTASTTANITATYNGVSKSAVLTIYPVLSLTAAATGTNKVTLYWNGISGASGYDIYRSTISGGPYTQIASNVSTADPGPGMTNAFMYSDTAGLTTGTEYFYVVWAVQSGAETTQSNEASASPNSNAIPWDTGTPAQIVSQISSSVASALEPDIDPDTGDTYPATVGILTACGPNGVLYQGNYTDGTAAAAYPPSSYYDSNSGTIIYGDGTAASAPAEGDDNADAPASGSSSTTGAGANSPALSFQISDLYNYAGNNTGIWRKILSQPGFWGASGTCGLPNLNDPNSVVLAVYPFPAISGKTGSYSDSGDIYFGGSVNYTGPVHTDPKTGKPAPYSDYQLDLGLQASASLAATSVPGWVPVVNSVDKKRTSPISATGNTRSIAVSGVTLTKINGNIKGNKIYAVNETRMQFITPNFPNIADQTVALHIAPPFGGVAGGNIFVAPFMQKSDGTLYLGTPVSYLSATLVYYAPGWRKSAINKASGNNIFSIKRTNSIAQTLFNADHMAYPHANGPSETPPVFSFLLDGSAIRGAYWGNNGDSRGVELNSNNSWIPWTDDNSQSLHSGAYPNSKLGGYGYVTWTNHNGFTFETNINLKANHTLP